MKSPRRSATARNNRGDSPQDVKTISTKKIDFLIISNLKDDLDQ